MQRRRLIVPADRRVLAWLLVVAALWLAAAVSLAVPDRAQALALLAQCANNDDDDGDNRIDFPFEPGCSSALDRSEVDPTAAPVCSNLANDDLDLAGADFPNDPGCRSAADISEADPRQVPQCADSIDNDGDSKNNYPADPGCSWAAETSEVDTACSNGIDDDGDGKADFPRDLGCAGVNDDDESDPPQCNDGRDNDGDGTLDFDTDIPAQSPDTDCASAVDTVEAPSTSGSSTPPTPVPARCADGRDNDGDGKTDFPADRGCSSAADDDEADTQIVYVLPVPAKARLLTPFPIVRIRGRSDRRGVLINLLTVRAPAASTVSVYCHGRRCPHARVAIRLGGTSVRLRQFERRLRGGSTLKIYVTKPGFIGKYTRFRFKSNRAPLRLDRCALSPGTQPHSCPAS
ncbi:MAG: hypothetical protein QOJ63_3617 [Solirubrobacteraceae bacterium]|jgi:hypothetical protein|nr:hypothetical protein [Solirubrobacteraceae bacterium]